MNKVPSKLLLYIARLISFAKYKIKNGGINMNYSIDAGHNCIPDKGATGIRQEDVLTKEVVKKIVEKIKALGFTITDCTPYGEIFQSVGASLEYRCEKANSSNSQLHLCIHFNSGGGEGVEVYAISQAGKAYAAKICDEIAALGYGNRGVKEGNHLYVINRTNMPCCLVECSFVDSQDDMNRYNADQIASAIVKAVIGQGVINPPVPLNPILKVFQHAANITGIRDKNGNALVEDGIIGELTKSVIDKILIVRGDKNELVKWVQQRLIIHGFNLGSVGADGDFGWYTLVEVQHFQASQRLAPDGKVGPLTINALLK